MRVLITSIAHNTHYYHLVPLAWALKSAGHEVRVASQPRITDIITGSGLTAVPVGDDSDLLELLTDIGGDIAPYQEGLDFAEDRPEALTWEHLLGQQTVLTSLCFAPLNGESTMDDIVALARSWQPDLVIWETFTYAGAVAAHAVGAAHARLLWGPDVIGQARERFVDANARQAPEHREDPMAEWLGWTLERLGLPAAGDGLEELLNGQWVIDPGAESLRLDLRGPTLPMRFVPYNGPAVVPGWLSGEPSESSQSSQFSQSSRSGERKRPQICLTQGVSRRETHGKDIVRFQDLLTALGDLDVEIVATLDSTQRENLTDVPGNVRIVDFVSMDVLLPTCAAIIHHGGAGTSATALLHGVPQIVIGAHWDAPLMARQLDDFGAGISIRPEDLDAATLRAAVQRVLTDPSLQQGADRLRAEIRSAPTPAELVPTLERLARSHRRSRSESPSDTHTTGALMTIGHEG
ncbi:activator-dependent family glycosyltransferase [Streptomyces sp. UNOB3_S3]|uniref:activator-dependent family glycosyltransferase n=1 Tax=Streptomyces sp. UNOB3_S3 TaxID=2871682 RepID=UPI001E31A79F|nr:activator-dependent family glycosyltransferase [Streptomyces sp. UNOB3_S3]MCC3777134.1 activator-dependent family glycosyltransferase [Streptomyces sp. UNOB3_S3]